MRTGLLTNSRALQRSPARRRGVQFARSLVETGLIDEYRLAIHPAVLGAGKRLSLAPLTLDPMSAIIFGGRAVVHVSATHGVMLKDACGSKAQTAVLGERVGPREREDPRPAGQRITARARSPSHLTGIQPA